MPTVIEDRGATVLVLNDDGTQVELTRESLDRVDPTFLGGNDQTSFIPPEQELLTPQLPPAERPAAQPIVPQAPEIPPAESQPEQTEEAASIPGVPSGLSSLPPAERLRAASELSARGSQRQLEARRQGVDAAVEQRDQALESVAGAREREADIAQREDEFFADHEKRVASAMATIEADISRLTSSKIDPNRRWRNLSTGRQILSIIAASVTGFGQALKGQGDKNPVIDGINAAIDRDVKLQLADRDALAAGIRAKTGLLGQLRANFATRQGHLEAARAASERMVALDLREMAARSKVPQAQQTLTDVAGQLDIQAAGRAEQIARFQITREDQERRLRAQLRSQAAGRAASARRQQAEFDFRREQAELDRQHKAEVAAAKAAGQGEPGRPILSTFTGKPLGRLPANLSAGEIKQFDETILGLEESAKQLAILRRRMKEVGKIFKGPASEFVQTEEGKALKALYTEYIRQKVRTFSGVTSRPDERADIEKSLQIDSFANIIGGDVNAIWEDEAQRVARVAQSWMIRKGQGQLDTQTYHDELLATGQAVENSLTTGELETGARTATSATAALDQLGGLSLQLLDNPSIIQRGGRFREAIAAASRIVEEQGDGSQKRELRRLRALMSNAITKARPSDFEVGQSRLRNPLQGPLDPTDVRGFPKEDLDRIFAPLSPLEAGR